MSPTDADAAAAPGARWRFWLAYASAWLALGAWLALNVVIGHRNSGQPIAAWEPITWEISSTAVMAVLAVLVHRFERREPLSGPHWPRRIPLTNGK